jgi:3-methyl-2-oxobutanoate hydroxymethyltransferase
MLGMFDRTARFVKRYHNIAEQIDQAAEQYADEVRERSFPGPDQLYQPKNSANFHFPPFLCSACGNGQ